MLGSEPVWRTTAPAKIVLTGEHAVMRGGPAVLLPHPPLTLEIRYWNHSKPLRILSSVLAAEVNQLLGRVRAHLQEVCGITWSPPSGLLEFASTIPVGAGLGSSAALCWALAQWCQQMTESRLSRAQMIELATRLEDQFHGRSSGMDIAGVSSDGPILFQQGKAVENLPLAQPLHLTLHDTGLRASTRRCVQQVAELARTDPAKGRRIDQQMGEAARQATDALRSVEPLQALGRAMNLAHNCYQQWDLSPAPVEELRQQLKQAGALGVKLTGSGGGGIMIALWQPHG